jgi:hypothetical protein
MSRLQSELVSLFGRETAQAAKKLPVDAIEQQAEQVAEYANRLYQSAGKPDQQRNIVQGMAQNTAMALCKWLSEPSLFSEIVGKQVSK